MERTTACVNGPCKRTDCVFVLSHMFHESICVSCGFCGVYDGMTPKCFLLSSKYLIVVVLSVTSLSSPFIAIRRICLRYMPTIS